MELVDSGTRRRFGTGAVRDGHEGVGRCDLLPLGVIGEQTNDNILSLVEAYIRNGVYEVLWEAICIFSKRHYNETFTALLEVSKQYEDGAKKYNDRNWENGIPLHCYIDSGVRHYLKFLRGDTDEPHDRAFIWNMLGAIWTHENKPELIDLPFADTGNTATENKPVEPWCEEDDERQNKLLCDVDKCFSGCVFKEKAIADKLESCEYWCQANPAEARKIMDEMEGKK